MQFRHGENFGKGFCSSTSAYKIYSTSAKDIPKLIMAFNLGGRVMLISPSMIFLETIKVMRTRAITYL